MVSPPMRRSSKGALYKLPTVRTATDPNAKPELGVGGQSSDLFLNAVRPRGAMTHTFPDATIKDYVRQPSL